MSRPATTAEPTTRPNPTRPGRTTRTTATTTGTTRSSGARTSTTSASRPRPHLRQRASSFGSRPRLRAATIPSTWPSSPASATRPSRSRTAATSSLRDFSILKGGHFGLLATGVDNLTIDNLKIDTDRDGMDIDCCQNVRVSNCTVNSPWDDGICPKIQLRPRLCARHREPHHHQLLRHRLLRAGHGARRHIQEIRRRRAGVDRTGRIKCGTESNGGFKNITISNCVFEGCLGYALESVDGALLEDITITNITMRDLYSGPIFMRLGARLRGPKESTKVGTMRRVLISNLACFNAPVPGSILTGIPGGSIEDVKLSNIYIETAGGGTAEMAKIIPPELEDGYPDPHRFGPIPHQASFMRHMRNVEMSHVEIANATNDVRPPST